jgi:GNAT superfamily N-acetyltransferase
MTIDFAIEPRRVITRSRLSSWLSGAMISERFAIDDDLTAFEHILDLRPRDMGPPIAHVDGYSIHPVSDHASDDPCIVVMTHRIIGFYHGPSVYIAPAHRGNGLGAAAIAASAQHEKTTRFSPGTVMGFSPAGYRAHESAWSIENDSIHQICIETV